MKCFMSNNNTIIFWNIHRIMFLALSKWKELYFILFICIKSLVLLWYFNMYKVLFIFLQTHTDARARTHVNSGLWFTVSFMSFSTHAFQCCSFLESLTDFPSWQQKTAAFRVLTSFSWQIAPHWNYELQRSAGERAAAARLRRALPGVRVKSRPLALRPSAGCLMFHSTIQDSAPVML